MGRNNNKEFKILVTIITGAHDACVIVPGPSILCLLASRLPHHQRKYYQPDEVYNAAHSSNPAPLD